MTTTLHPPSRRQAGGRARAWTAGARRLAARGLAGRRGVGGGRPRSGGSGRRGRSWLPRAALRRLSLAALAAALVLVLVWALLASSLLSVRTVQVVGADRTTPQAVLAAAAVPEGAPVARVDTRAAAARVAALGPVDRVRVERAWPTGIRVVVAERVPLASVRQADGTYALVDAEAVRFAPAATVPDGVPELQVAGPVEPALQVLAALPEQVAGKVRAVQSPKPDEVVLLLEGGRRVLWGGADTLERKAEIVGALLGQPGSVIDVSSPRVAVVR